jgi:regulator of sigma E protease
MRHYPKVPTPRNPVVGYLVPDGAAAKAGIREGDRVVQIENITSPNWEDIALKEIASAREPLQVWVDRNGERLHFTLTPTYEEKQGVGILGWRQESEVEVASISPGLEADRAGLKRGDVLVSANGIPLRNIARLREIENETAGQPLDIRYLRNGQPHHVTVTPAKRDPDGQGQHWMIGLTVQDRVEITKLPLHTALYESCRQNLQSAALILKFIERIAERRMSPKSVVGPIGIAQLSGEAAREGAASFFGLMAAVSLNLAIFNLLPIPILDGGVMLMLIVEMLLRRDLDLKVRETVMRVGLVFLMVIVVFVIYNDISKILPPG